MSEQAISLDVDEPDRLERVELPERCPAVPSHERPVHVSDRRALRAGVDHGAERAHPGERDAVERDQ